jgi:hypothetical protein
VSQKISSISIKIGSKTITQLMNLMLRIWKLGVLKVPSIQGLTKNGQSRALFDEFLYRINLAAFLFGYLGLEIKLQIKKKIM